MGAVNIRPLRFLRIAEYNAVVVLGLYAKNTTGRQDGMVNSS